MARHGHLARKNRPQSIGEGTQAPESFEKGLAELGDRREPCPRWRTHLWWCPGSLMEGALEDLDDVRDRDHSAQLNLPTPVGVTITLKELN